MSKRAISMTPTNVERRERRLFSKIDRDLAEWHEEVLAYMRTWNVSFDVAFVACCGTIIPLKFEPR